MTDSTRGRFETPRLTLVEATIPLLRAEGEHVAKPTHSLQSELESLLGAEVAAPWPPPLNDDDSRRWMIRLLETNPEPGWGMWYFLLKRDGDRPVAAGNGGYKGPPTSDGTVEIGYSVVPAYQGLGIAREAIAALVARAFRDPRVQRVVAETMSDNVPSLRALERNGFLRAGPGAEPGSVRLERVR